MDTTQVHISNDVVMSGVLAKLSPREGQVLLMLASYAMRDSRRGSYRTAYAYHGDWGEKLGITRQRVCSLFRSLEKKNVIKKVDKRHVKNGQPANIYAIAEFEALCDLAWELERENKRGGNSNLQKGQGVRSSGHLQSGKVSGQADTLVSHLPDTLPEKVSHLPDTEVVLKEVEVGSRKGTNGSFPSENGENSNGNGNGNGNPSPDDAEIEAQKAAAQRAIRTDQTQRDHVREINARRRKARARRTGRTYTRSSARRVEQLELGLTFPASTSAAATSHSVQEGPESPAVPATSHRTGHSIRPGDGGRRLIGCTQVAGDSVHVLRCDRVSLTVIGSIMGSLD